MTRSRQPAATILCLVLTGAVAAACGGQSAVCSDMDALRTSVENLQNVQIGENALSTLKTDLKQIQADVQQFGKDASGQYSSQIETVKKQTAALGSSLQSASSDPSAATFTQVSNDVKGLASAVSGLGTSLSDSCQ